MIRPAQLNEYSARERYIGEDISTALLSEEHTIRDATAIYPEWQLTPPFGLHRPGVNVATLLFLYRQVVAYVPPMLRTDFPARFGVSFEVFVNLAYPGGDTSPFIFPVLNHPRRYRSPAYRDDLAPLLMHMPPTWERWHQALEVTGGKRWFAHADERFNYSGIWSIPQLRSAWEKRLQTSDAATISKEIKQQVRNNYTDLCLVGREGDANDIAALSHEQPHVAAAELFYASDLRAYPLIMGAGALANVRLPKRPPMRLRASLRSANIPKDVKDFDSDVLETMFRGLRLHRLPPDVSVDFLLKWHMSKQAEIAREAYASLLGVARGHLLTLEDFHRTLKTVLTEMESFVTEQELAPSESYEKSGKRQDLVVNIATVGSLAATALALAKLGGLLYVNDALVTWLGGGFSAIGGVTWFQRRQLLRRILRKYAPDVPPDLYENYTRMRDFVEDYVRRKREFASGHAVDQGQSETVRTLWWPE